MELYQRVNSQQINVPSLKGATPLMALQNWDLRNICIDSMHCLWEGVMKLLVKLWLESPKTMAFSCKDQVTRFDNHWKQLRPPKDMACPIRSICDYKHWRAAEFRQLLLYGADLLAGYLLFSKEKYKEHWWISMEWLYWKMSAIVTLFPWCLDTKCNQLSDSAGLLSEDKHWPTLQQKCNTCCTLTTLLTLNSICPAEYIQKLLFRVPLPAREGENAPQPSTIRIITSMRRVMKIRVKQNQKKFGSINTTGFYWLPQKTFRYSQFWIKDFTHHSYIICLHIAVMYWAVFTMSMRIEESPCDMPMSLKVASSSLQNDSQQVKPWYSRVSTTRSIPTFSNHDLTLLLSTVVIRNEKSISCPLLVSFCIVSQS